jgi:hypothetical protein
MGWNMVGREHPVKVYLTNVTEGDGLEASIYWDSVTHRNGAYDKADYPNRTEVVGYDEAAAAAFALDINLTLPDDPGPVFIIVHALVGGADHYDVLERSISVVAEPVFNTTAFPRGVLLGADAHLTWYVPNMAGNYVQGTLVLWDEESHGGEAFNLSDWPSSTAELPGNNSRTYEADVTVPGEETTWYMVVAARVRDEWFVSEEHVLRVVAEPSLEVDPHAPSGFADTETIIAWRVLNASWEDVDETGLDWGTEEGGPYTSSEVMGPSETMEFEALVELPGEAPGSTSW